MPILSLLSKATTAGETERTTGATTTESIETTTSGERETCGEDMTDRLIDNLSYDDGKAIELQGKSFNLSTEGIETTVITAYLVVQGSPAKFVYSVTPRSANRRGDYKVLIRVRDPKTNEVSIKLMLVIYRPCIAIDL